MIYLHLPSSSQLPWAKLQWSLQSSPVAQSREQDLNPYWKHTCRQSPPNWNQHVHDWNVTSSYGKVTYLDRFAAIKDTATMTGGCTFTTIYYNWVYCKQAHGVSVSHPFQWKGGAVHNFFQAYEVIFSTEVNEKALIAEELCVPENIYPSLDQGLWALNQFYSIYLCYL